MPILKPYDPDMFAPGFKNLGTPTKGSVIVGNGSTWQKLTVGTDGTVLTANSGETTGLEWVATGGGGGIYTVVSDEAELIAALAAQDPLIYIDTNITATQDYAVTDDAEVRIGSGVTLAMPAVEFVVSSGVIFSLTGDGKDVSSLSWTPGGNDVIRTPGLATLFMNNISFTEVVSGLAGNIISGGSFSFYINDVDFIFANNGTTRFQTGVFSGSHSNLINVTFTGGGAICANKVSISGSSGYLYVNNVFYNGTWNASGDEFLGDFSGTFDGVFVSDSTVVRLNLSALEISNVVAVNSTINVSVCRSMNNVYFDTIEVSGSVFKVINNFSINTITNTGSSFIMTNGLITDAVSWNSYSNISCTSVTFIGGVGLTSCSDFSFVNCEFGNYASPGAATTLTIAGSCVRTIATSCKSDSAIVDSGSTGPQIANNTVF